MGEEAQSRADGSWRTQNFFLLIRMITLGTSLCEFLISNTMLATPGLAHSAAEQDSTTFPIQIAWGNILMAAWILLCGSAILYNGSQIFSWWIVMMRGPLDVFEQIHICGKQVASKFYDTREDIKAEAEDIEPEAEDAMQDSDH